MFMPSSSNPSERRQKMRKFFMCTFLIFLIVSASNTLAAPITFTHSGTGSGSLAGSPFSNASFTITSEADTDNRLNFLNYHLYFTEHTSASIWIEGEGTFQFNTGTSTFVNQSSTRVGFSPAYIVEARDLFQGPANSAFSTWDMLSAIGPYSGNGNLLQWDQYPVNTSGGILLFDTATTLASFQAHMVPMPAPVWLLGTGLIGLVGFRRKFWKVTVTR
jgi:hypothetical protein